MQPKVTVYSTQSCHYCKEVKDFLDKYNISYTSIDVGSDATKRREMIEKSNQMGVPVTVIGEEVIVGFKKDKMLQLLSLTEH